MKGYKIGSYEHNGKTTQAIALRVQAGDLTRALILTEDLVRSISDKEIIVIDDFYLADIADISTDWNELERIDIEFAGFNNLFDSNVSVIE